MLGKNKDLENRGWESMSHILDKEMPQEKKKRRPFIWLTFGLVAASLVLFYVSSISYNSELPNASHQSQDNMTASSDVVKESSPSFENAKEQDEAQVFELKNRNSESTQSENTIVKKTNHNIDNGISQMSEKNTIAVINTIESSKTPHTEFKVTPINAYTNGNGEEQTASISRQIEEEQKITESDVTPILTSAPIQKSRDAYSYSLLRSLGTRPLQYAHYSIDDPMMNAVEIRNLNNSRVYSRQIRLGLDAQVDDQSRIGVIGAIRWNVEFDWGTIYSEVGAMYSRYDGERTLSSDVEVEVFTDPFEVETGLFETVVLDEGGFPVAGFNLGSQSIDLISRTNGFARIGFKKNIFKEFYLHANGQFNYILDLKNTEVLFDSSTGVLNNVVQKNNINSDLFLSTLDKKWVIGYGLGIGYELNNRWSIEVNTNREILPVIETSQPSSPSGDNTEIFDASFVLQTNRKRFSNNISVNVLKRF